MCFTLSILPGWYFVNTSCSFICLISYRWNSPAASFLLIVSLRNGWKHYNLIFHHVCTLNNAGEELCCDSCALWFPEAFQHRWMIVPFSLPWFWELTVSRSVETTLPTMPQWVSLSCYCSSTENLMLKVNKAWEMHTAEQCRIIHKSRGTSCHAA